MWVRPAFGDRLVTNWDGHASLEAIDDALPHLSPTRLQDLGPASAACAPPRTARAPVGVAEEPWLFPSEDGVPPTGEQFDDAWHVVLDAVGWSRTIPYRNLRHHAVLWRKAMLPMTDTDESTQLTLTGSSWAAGPLW